MNNTEALMRDAVSGFEDIAGKYLTFSLGQEEYGIQIVRVREIMGMVEITPVPRTPEHVRGVINLRGKVIPVICLRLKFGLAYKEPDQRTCIMVVEVEQAGNIVQMGVVVDRVNEVAEIKGDAIEPPPGFGMAVDTSFLFGMAKVGDKVKLLLDIDRALTGS